MSIGTGAKLWAESDTEKNSRWRSDSSHESEENTESRQAQMKRSPTGADSISKHGIAALQIRDLSTSMHSLLEGCRP